MQHTQIKGLFDTSIELPSLIDEIPLGIVVLDTQRRIVLINRSFEALSGFSMEDARGIPCFHIMRSRLCVQKCPLKKMDSNSESISVESDMVNRERQLIPVLINLSPIKDTEGNLTGFLETVEDLRPLKEVDDKTPQAYTYRHLIGKSPEMTRIFQILPLLAQSDSAILITGETGTGKDVLAEAVHQASNRAKGPFVKVNCGALPETLLESELFGHRKGAFTGAVENKPGRFRLAHNGTLYLTEIGDLPLQLQVKLLTFLDDKVVYPLGTAKGFQADVRVIAATHRNLDLMVKERKFREDLMYRLNVVRLHLPPLRERGDDIRLILDHFINIFATRFRKDINRLSKRALKILMDYPFPGNVRELRNIIEYAVNICPRGQIQFTHLPAYLAETKHQYDRSTSEAGEASEWTASFVKSNNEQSGQKTWAYLERDMIIEALVKSKGRRNKTADMLGWGRSTLWRKMKQYKIDA
ncbi:MAG: sigma 54-interacting transcriptional regulator [Deltaproteobacteria bacterium]|nr:sigma 54-interacting transcriptional regulator [Deltaproteobacteria bacterium]MBW2669265.1 sigma 54-interacting transcriptional regulator [Deltaproteobacteria bacterium]